jgi:hypothetical protein
LKESDPKILSLRGLVKLLAAQATQPFPDIGGSRGQFIDAAPFLGSESKRCFVKRLEPNTPTPQRYPLQFPPELPAPRPLLERLETPLSTTSVVLPLVSFFLWRNLPSENVQPAEFHLFQVQTRFILCQNWTI